MEKNAAGHPNVDPQRFVWPTFDRIVTLQTQFDMNYWIAELECMLKKRGASKKHKKEPILNIRVNIDASSMKYDPNLYIIYPR